MRNSGATRSAVIRAPAVARWCRIVSQRRRPIAKRQQARRRGRAPARGSSRDGPERQAAGQRDAVVQRRQPGERLERSPAAMSSGKNVPENRNSGVIPNRKIAANLFGRLLGRGERRDRRRRTPSRSGPRPGWPARSAATRPPRTATMTNVKTEQISVSRAAIQSEVAEGDVARRDRRRVHRVEDLVPDEPAHDREGRLEGGRLHRRRRQQAGREEREVADPAEAVGAGLVDVARRGRGPSPPGTGPATGTS